MIKTTQVIRGLDIGGTEMMLYKTVTHLDSRRYSSHVVSLTTPGVIGRALAQIGIPVTAQNQRPGVPDLRIVWKLYRLLKDQQPHILQSYMYEANLYALLAGRLARIPVVWGIRCADMDWKFYSPFSRLAFHASRWLSRFPDAIIVNSEAGRRYHIAQGYAGRRMVVIPNGFEIDRFRPNAADRASVRAEFGIPPDGILIGRFARDDAMKDYATLVRAAGIVAQKNVRAFFVFAGTGITPENVSFGKMIQNEGVADRVILLGVRDDVPRLTAALDLAVSSSISEGFPNVVGEAMACGVPCVVTDVGDSAFLVDDTGLVVPPKNPTRLAEAILQMIDLTLPERERMGQAARERVETHFDIEKIAERTGRLYDNLLAGRGIKLCVV